MSQENVELVRAALAAFIEVEEGLADVQRLDEFLAPDGTWEMGTYSGWPGQRTFRGVGAVLDFFAAWSEPYDEWSYDVEKILDAGANQVVVTFHQRGKPHGSDSWVEMRYGIVYTVKGGLLSRAQMYATPEEALEAAGLSE
jgi:ketosteroid isomerase-like protein